MKRGKFSKVEIEYIKNNHENMTLKGLSIDLDRTEASISKVIEELDLKTKEPERTSEVFQDGRVQSLMGRRVINGKVAATVMTEAASEFIDDNKSPASTRYTKDVICKPLGDGKFNNDGTFKPN